MITTTLQGGLGNQMFMYAMVRALSLRNRVPMAFNTGLGFKTDYQFHRSLELIHLNVKLPTARLATFDVPLARIWLKLSKMIGRNVLLPPYKVLRETSENRHMDIINQKVDNIYLLGYWQSELYFKDFEKEIREDFRIMTPMPHRTLQELSKIQSLGENTVMVGVRRYQECTKETNIPVLSKEFYDKAIKEMIAKVENPVFVVFCQDHEWAKRHIRIEGFKVHYVKPKDGVLATIEDLYLMTHLRHFIISNSSYFWWGAWLANYADKIVLAPTNFAHPYSVCKDWETVEI